MAVVSIRMSNSDKKKLIENAKKRKMTLSNYCKRVLKQDIPEEDENWKIVCWNLFGIDILSINYALQRSGSVPTFFAFLSRKCYPYITITPRISEGIVIDISVKDKVYTLTSKERQPVETVVKNLITQFEEKVFEEYGG